MVMNHHNGFDELAILLNSPDLVDTFFVATALEPGREYLLACTGIQ